MTSFFVLRRRKSALAALALAGVAVTAITACSTDTPIAPDLDPASIYQSLTLDQHGITLGPSAPYDTLTLVATARSADGAVLHPDSPVRFTSSDSTSIRVTDGGQLIALVPGRSAVVFARLTIGGVTRVDSTQVTVYPTATPPVITALSVQPKASDSAKVAASKTKVITSYFINGSDTLSGLKAQYHLANYKLGTMNEFTGSLSAKAPGVGMIVASATVFGQRWTDSVLFTVGLPLTGFSTAQILKKLDGSTTYQFTPSTIYIGVGGVVNWNTTAGFPGSTALPYDVVFDRVEHVKADPQKPYAFDGNVDGNIEAWSYAGGFFGIQRSRMFSAADTIVYHSTVYAGAVGRIIVIDDSACVPNCIVPGTP
jgi:hypothetical protein